MKSGADLEPSQLAGVEHAVVREREIPRPVADADTADALA
jgi:hypothetical protein